MAETRMNPMVKWLLIAIAFLLLVFLIAGISIFVYIRFQEIGKAESVTAEGGEIKVRMELEEFKFPSADGGLCSFKMELELSDEDVQKELEKHLSYIRDNVPRRVMDQPLQRIKEMYISGELHKTLEVWLNTNLVKPMPAKKTWMFGPNKVYSIVRVNIYDLSAMKME